MASKAQSVIFRKDGSPADVNEGKGWTVAAAKAWAEEHGFRSDNVDEGETEIRLRQFDPGDCQGGEKTLTENLPEGVRIFACDVAEARGRPTPGTPPPAADKEVRYFRKTEIRIAGTENEPVLEGHVAVFNEPSEDFGGWREIILPGAFAEALKGDVRALWNHDSSLVLGRTAAGTLELAEDPVGLFMRAKPPQTDWFKDKAVSLKRGDVTGSSFGFFAEIDEWVTDAGQRLRKLLKINPLFEVSAGVTFPAYPQTDVALRRLGAWVARHSPGQIDRLPGLARVMQGARRRRELDPVTNLALLAGWQEPDMHAFLESDPGRIPGETAAARQDRLRGLLRNLPKAGYWLDLSADHLLGAAAADGLDAGQLPEKSASLDLRKKRLVLLERGLTA